MQHHSNNNVLRVVFRQLKQHRQITTAVGLVVMFGFIGVLVIRTSSAAVYVASTEAESGTLAGNAGAGDTVGASGGGAVKFGVNTGGGGIYDGNDYPNAHLDRCPNAATASSPSGNIFANGTFDGGGKTLSGSFSVGSNVCIQNFNFSGATLSLGGSPSNVTIVNNTFQNSIGAQSISNVSGTNVTINFNTFNGPSIGTYTGVFGREVVKGFTFNHNQMNMNAAGVDGIQIQFGYADHNDGSNNSQISYNRILNGKRYPIELQGVVHGLKIRYNYVSTDQTGIPYTNYTVTYQLSIAVGNQDDNAGVGLWATDTSGVEIDHNIVKSLNSGGNHWACIEIRGPGVNAHDNYCWNFQNGCDFDYILSKSGQQVPWYFNNNTVIGSGAGCIWEGHDTRSGGASPPQGGTGGIGNKLYSASNAPPEPAWNYKVGKQ